MANEFNTNDIPIGINSLTAEDVANVPSGDITSDNVQGAINELDEAKQSLSLYTTKGDAIFGTGNGTAARNGVGSNNTLKVADSGQATGWKNDFIKDVNIDSSLINNSLIKHKNALTLSTFALALNDNQEEANNKFQGQINELVAKPTIVSANSQSGMLALSNLRVGDLCARTDTAPYSLFRLNSTPSSTIGNWKSGITGTLYGQIIYELSNNITGQGTLVPIPFNKISSSIGLTSFVSNVSGVLTLQAGFMYELQGMAIHYNAIAGGLGFKWRVNGALKGTYGSSATSVSSDNSVGASSPARYLFTIPAGESTQNCDLELTGFAILNIFSGNYNIASSYISVKAYNL